MKISNEISFDNFVKFNDSKTPVSGGVKSAEPSFKIKEINVKKPFLNETKANIPKPKTDKPVSASKPKEMNKKAENYNGIFMNSGHKELLGQLVDYKPESMIDIEAIKIDDEHIVLINQPSGIFNEKPNGQNTFESFYQKDES